MTDAIGVMTSGAFHAALLALLPGIERTTGIKVVVLSTSIGIGETYIPNRLRRGEIADVVIVADDVLRQCMEDGLVIRDRHVPLAHSSIAMAVRLGADRPDISTLEALRRTMLNASSVGYSASVSGQYIVSELCKQLSITDEVVEKWLRIGNERIGAVIARGEVEIGFEQMSELLPVPGIAHVTPLPAAAQKISTFSAGIGTNTRDVSMAREVIRYLHSAEARAAIIESGLQPNSG